MKKLLTIALLTASTLSANAQQNTDSTEYDSYQKFRIGGYGEMVASFKNYGINRFNGTAMGNSSTHRATVAIPRFVVAGDYKFNAHWSLGVEVEFEAGGTGSAIELENTENGEYETEVEKGGEVALEQFHISYRPNSHFTLRAGHMIVPVGLTNSHHEPILFFGTVRPEGETTLLPSTWHETGLSISGQLGRRWTSFDYEAMVVSGLNPNGFDRNTWVGSGRQGIFEADNFTSPGYAARIQYKGIPGLRLGASVYYCHNAGSNADKPQTYNFKIPVTLWSVDAQYQHRYFTARGNILSGNVGNSSQLSAKNSRLSNLSPYSRTAPIAQRGVSYGMEAGVRLKNFTHNHRMPDIIPFARYEYYNPQQKVVVDKYSSTPADPRLKTSMWVAGINYRPLPYLVVKADYTTRRIADGKCNNENEFAIGVAFTNWFWKK
ncbi:MAG: hypothetical protein KBT39_12235 [Bacteroidales bacterium]|nr:hypothetical protein [Bacteroidales bacterium]